MVAIAATLDSHTSSEQSQQTRQPRIHKGRKETLRPTRKLRMMAFFGLNGKPKEDTSRRTVGGRARCFRVFSSLAFGAHG
jgi:hypothetical protein